MPNTALEQAASCLIALVCAVRGSVKRSSMGIDEDDIADGPAGIYYAYLHPYFKGSAQNPFT